MNRSYDLRIKRLRKDHSKQMSSINSEQRNRSQNTIHQYLSSTYNIFNFHFITSNLDYI